MNIIFSVQIQLDSLFEKIAERCGEKKTLVVALLWILSNLPGITLGTATMILGVFCRPSQWNPILCDCVFWFVAAASVFLFCKVIFQPLRFTPAMRHILAQMQDAPHSAAFIKDDTPNYRIAFEQPLCSIKTDSARQAAYLRANVRRLLTLKLIEYGNLPKTKFGPLVDMYADSADYRQVILTERGYRVKTGVKAEHPIRNWLGKP